jgi:hypothetical protein
MLLMQPRYLVHVIKKNTFGTVMPRHGFRNLQKKKALINVHLSSYAAMLLKN